MPFMEAGVLEFHMFRSVCLVKTQSEEAWVVVFCFCRVGREQCTGHRLPECSFRRRPATPNTRQLSCRRTALDAAMTSEIIAPDLKRLKPCVFSI
jgi:hypothetical protein